MIKKFITTLACTLVFSVVAEEGKPYKVFLKSGSELTKIKDKKKVVIERGIYAFVLETSPTRREIFNVYDKEGKIQYQTLASSIVEIEDDIRVLPKANAEISYPAPTIEHGYNEKFYFDTQFNTHLDNVDISQLNGIYTQGSSSSTIGNRFELRTLYISELPVNFGLGLNYQRASWNNEADDINLSILSLGPQIQHYIYEDKEKAVSLHLGAEYAPIYKTTSGESAEKYKAIVLDLGIESLWDTRFGKWSLGAHFRRHDLTLTSTTRANAIALPEEIIINTIGGMLGYKYEWEL